MSVSDVDVGALVLQVAGMRPTADTTQRVDQRLTDASLERSMDQASTLTFTFDDSDRQLIRSGLFNEQIDVELDGLWFRMVQVSKSGDSLTLTFEDRLVSLLRQNTTPRKAARSKMTRAEFVLSMLREVKTGAPYEFICPALHTVQPIQSASAKLTSSSRKNAVAGGLPTGGSFTAKGAPCSKSQIQLAERALDVASSVGASERATLALIEACIIESVLSNPTTPSADGYGSRGILQVRDVTAAGMGISNTDVEACCNAFLMRGFTGAGGAITVAAKNPTWTTGKVAQTVQGSAYPTRYDQVSKEAQRFVDAYTGASAGSIGGTTAAQPYSFQRGGTSGKPEDSWTAMKRLASEVRWACYVNQGQLFFVSQGTLIRQKPIATLSEQSDGVDVIDFDIDNGKMDNGVTMTVHADRWGFDPGSCVVLEDCGPADGRWLVNDVQRSLFDRVATVTLKRAQKALAEPAQDASSAGLSGSQQNFGSGVAGAVGKAYSAAKAMDAKRYPYVWGGGHAHVGTPDRGTGRDPGIGFDCSGSTCAILAAGGMGFRMGGPADVSGTIAASWGDAGEGQQMTVWANQTHVWIEFKTSQGDQHFGTGDWGSDTGTGGPAFQARMHTKAGFTPRHWPGT